MLKLKSAFPVSNNSNGASVISLRKHLDKKQCQKHAQLAQRRMEIKNNIEAFELENPDVLIYNGLPMSSHVKPVCADNMIGATFPPKTFNPANVNIAPGSFQHRFNKAVSAIVKLFRV